MRFKKLRVKRNGKIINFDGYYLCGEIEDYNFYYKQSDESYLIQKNNNYPSILDEEHFDNAVKLQLEVSFHIYKKSSNGKFKDSQWFRTQEIIEYEF